jgi:radical SAM protein with 4Fe4S-binding SPASM domain
MDRAAGATYARPFPRVVRIEPSGACNLRCSHCPTGTIKMQRGIMTPEIFGRVLTSVQRNLENVKVVVLYHGGEPLLSRHFVDMVRQVKNLGVPFVKTVSNGMLLDDAAIAGLLASGLDAIEFSLDGESPEENDLIRRNARFQLVVSNIHRLIARRRKSEAAQPEIFLATTQFLREGQDPCILPSPPVWLLREFNESGEAIAGFKCNWAQVWPHMKVATDLFRIYAPPAHRPPAFECDHVDHTVTVAWNGDLLACCYDLTHQMVLGNVTQDELEDVWNGRRYLDLRARIGGGDLPLLCRNCNVVRTPVYLVRRDG